MTVFVIPIIILSTCYLAVIITVQKRLLGRSKRKTRAIKLASLVVLVFYCCVFPGVVIKLTFIYDIFDGRSMTTTQKRAHYDVQSFTTLAHFSNSCLNPVVYAFIVPAFQKHLFRIIGCAKSAQKVGEDLKRNRSYHAHVIHRPKRASGSISGNHKRGWVDVRKKLRNLKNLEISQTRNTSQEKSIVKREKTFDDRSDFSCPKTKSTQISSFIETSV